MDSAHYLVGSNIIITHLAHLDTEKTYKPTDNLLLIIECADLYNHDWTCSDSHFDLYQNITFRDMDCIAWGQLTMCFKLLLDVYKVRSKYAASDLC